MVSGPHEDDMITKIRIIAPGDAEAAAAMAAVIHGMEQVGYMEAESERSTRPARNGGTLVYLSFVHPPRPGYSPPYHTATPEMGQDDRQGGRSANNARPAG